MDMYTERIIEHSQHPSHWGHLDRTTASAIEYNPLCGDTIEVELFEKKGKVEKVSFTGRGCALSKASMSLLSDQIIGRGRVDIERLTLHDIQDMLSIPISPARIACVMLGLSAVKSALFGKGTKKGLKERYDTRKKTSRSARK